MRGRTAPGTAATPEDGRSASISPGSGLHPEQQVLRRHSLQAALLLQLLLRVGRLFPPILLFQSPCSPPHLPPNPKAVAHVTHSSSLKHGVGRAMMLARPLRRVWNGMRSAQQRGVWVPRGLGVSHLASNCASSSVATQKWRMGRWRCFSVIQVLSAS